ncbi:MAG: ribonuclease D [Hyphomicrobiaceae bacterium]
MSVKLHQDDLPAGVSFSGAVAIDTETLGLNPHRDRLCLVQLSAGDGNAHLVQIRRGQREAPRLKALLTDESVVKIFHFARFDLATLSHHLGVMPRPVYCTKIASKLVRTYTDRHGLKDLCRELLGVELSKEQQSSDWGAPTLSNEQLGYAASDVLHLHKLKTVLDRLLEREGRTGLAEACFRFLPARAELDLLGFVEPDILTH